MPYTYVRDLNGEVCRDIIAVERALMKSNSEDSSLKWLQKNRTLCNLPRIRQHIALVSPVFEDLRLDLWVKAFKN